MSRISGGESVRLAILVAGLAIHLRLAMTVFDPNFDFESYNIVSGIRLDGGNVYASTDRYNYGPVWFLILEALARVTRATGFGSDGFRILVVLVLSAADVGIARVLFLRYGRRAAVFFLFAPVGLIITGQHHQFDNVAVLFGMVAVLLFGDCISGRLRGREWCGLLLLGLSLSTKHLLLIFPLWLMMKQVGPVRRLIVLSLPTAVFIFSFLPWLTRGGWDGIRQNVIGYRSFDNAPLLATLFGSGVSESRWPMLVFAFALGSGAVLSRRCRPLDSILVYLVVVTIFSPAMANQYLAIPLAAVAVAWNVGFAAWLLAASAFLIGNPSGLNVMTVREALTNGLTSSGRTATYRPLIWMLVGASIFWLINNRTSLPGLRSPLDWLKGEFRFQLLAFQASRTKR